MPSLETDRVDGKGLTPLRELGSDDRLDELVRVRIAAQVAYEMLQVMFDRTGYTSVREARDVLHDAIRPDVKRIPEGTL